ncbi:hypothetical protein ACM55G_14820 [Flavobacterium sp. LB3P122]|uniref:hypothetical protein n=1 Tax=Flavobacterium algoriphilum TaxID=3398738 RepID=UPI003A87E6B7
MSLIKIIANNIELDFVKETLSIKKENNALSRDFKVSYSSIPFLIIENTNTKKALGTRDLSSVKKIKTIEVVVFEAGKKYSGELQILSYLNGFRKCNLKFSSSLLSIMNKKISEFMPIVSVIPGETNPVPFTETTDVTISGGGYWKSYPIPFLSKTFPEVRWQFPTMNWTSKFGENLDEGDTWFLYGNKINQYDINGLILNTEKIGLLSVIKNRNVPSAQPYLLSPLFYALESKGYVSSGNFVNSDFIKKILFLGSKNNLTKSKYTSIFEPIAMPALVSRAESGGYYYSLFQYTIPSTGIVEIKYNFAETNFTSPNPQMLFKELNIEFMNPNTYEVISSVYYTYYQSTPDKVFSGVATFLVSPDQVNFLINIGYRTPQNSLPVNVISKDEFQLQTTDYYEMHPTIELGRYVPDWTFATYLNNLQNLFNVEINIDDLAKKMTIDFNEESISTGKKSVIKKSLAFTGYEQTPLDAFLLKYENSEDVALWVTKEGVGTYGSQTSNFVERLDNKFKFVPTSSTAELSEALDTKNGVGLMIYDPITKPYTTENYLGQTLKIQGLKGIYEVYWRKFIKFLLNGSAVEMSGPFTETELNQILSLKRIFVDNQEYLVASTELRETDQNNYEVKFNLISITF